MRRTFPVADALTSGPPDRRPAWLRTGRRGWPLSPWMATLAAYILLAGLVLAPFVSVAVPALGDTLNHLARMHVLAGIAGSADLQRYYVVRWAPIPYLAMDAIVPLMLRVLPVYLAGKLFVCACVVMPAAATLLLHYVVHRRVSLVPAAAFLLCTNYLLALGFLNYLFSASVAVMLFAGWVAARGWPRWRRALLFAPLVLLLYLGHVFACLAYCLAVCGTELSLAMRARRAAWRGTALDLMAAAAQALPALGLAAGLDVGSGYVGGLNTEYGSLGAKLVALASPMLFLIDRVHLATILAALAGAGLLLRRVRLAASTWPAALCVGLASCAMPHVLSSTWGMDLRLPIVAAMLLVGSASLPAAGAWRWPACAVLACLVGARAADDWGVLHRVDAQVAETRRVLAGLPHGARLLVVNTDGHGTGLEQVTASTAWHMPLLAVIDRDAFVPYFFNGLSTVHMRPEMRLSSTPNGLPISPDTLRAGALLQDDGMERGDGLGARLYARGWPGKFDDVLVQRYGTDPGPMPANLALIARSENLDLYRVQVATSEAHAR